MINFISENENAIIMYNNKQIDIISKGAYLCSVGIGSNQYKMSHGSFKIKEAISQKEDVYVKSIEITNNKMVVDGGNVLFEIEAQNESRIKITPKINGDYNYNRLWICYKPNENEGIYGCGEIFSDFNLKGKKVNVWVAEHINAMQIAKKLLKQIVGIKNTTKKQRFSNYETYYAQPTFLSSEKYYFHSETTAKAEFDFENKYETVLKFEEICPFYFGFADDFEALQSNMANLLGTQPELPDWVYDGAILGIQGGTDIMMKKVETCLNHNTDVCGVWIQDWEGRRVTAVGKQLQWNWEWDEELYPSLNEKINELNEKGIRVLGYINPFLAVEKPLYKQASEKGYCVKNKDGEDYLVTITTFPAAMIDFTNPDAWNWTKKIIKENMIDFGLSGWMADFSEYLPTDCVLFSGENPEVVHNTWPGKWAKLNREVLEENGKLGEIMFFTRAGNTDTVKYSTMMWNGDNHVDYSIDFGLPSVIPASLSLTCSGYGLAHSDIGGYTTFFNLKRNSELFMRWAEMNAFTPVFRSHEGLNPDANVQFDHDENVLNHHAKMSRIHKALKPYLKECVKYNNEKGVGVMRPLFFYYNEEKAFNEGYEYLLGRDILVAPVIKANVKSAKVYLPNDNWVHLWSEKEYSGGEYIVDAKIGEPPVFIRKSSKDFNSLMAVKNI